MLAYALLASAPPRKLTLPIHGFRAHGWVNITLPLKDFILGLCVKNMALHTGMAAGCGAVWWGVAWCTVVSN